MSQIAAVWLTVTLSFAALLSALRVVRAGTTADRTIGLDMAVVVLASAIICGAAATGRTAFLTVVTVVALLAFVATVTIARFLEPATPRQQRSEPDTGRQGSAEGGDK